MIFYFFLNFERYENIGKIKRTSDLSSSAKSNRNGKRSEGRRYEALLQGALADDDLDEADLDMEEIDLNGIVTYHSDAEIVWLSNVIYSNCHTSYQVTLWASFIILIFFLNTLPALKLVVVIFIPFVLILDEVIQVFEIYKIILLIYYQWTEYTHKPLFSVNID